MKQHGDEDRGCVRQLTFSPRKQQTGDMRVFAATVTRLPPKYKFFKKETPREITVSQAYLYKRFV